MHVWGGSGCVKVLFIVSAVCAVSVSLYLSRKLQLCLSFLGLPVLLSFPATFPPASSPHFVLLIHIHTRPCSVCPLFWGAHAHLSLNFDDRLSNQVCFVSCCCLEKLGH